MASMTTTPMDNANQELAALHRGLGRLEGKMDLLLQNENNRRIEDNTKFEKVDRRLSGVERKLLFMSGVFAVGIVLTEKAIAFLLK